MNASHDQEWINVLRSPKKESYGVHWRYVIIVRSKYKVAEYDSCMLLVCNSDNRSQSHFEIDAVIEDIISAYFAQATYTDKEQLI